MQQTLLPVFRINRPCKESDGAPPGRHPPILTNRVIMQQWRDNEERVEPRALTLYASKKPAMATASPPKEAMLTEAAPVPSGEAPVPDGVPEDSEPEPEVPLGELVPEGTVVLPPGTTTTGVEVTPGTGGVLVGTPGTAVVSAPAGTEGATSPEVATGGTTTLSVPGSSVGTTTPVVAAGTSGVAGGAWIWPSEIWEMGWS